MIPAQCGVSRAVSEGLMASMRKATAVTATPSSSCSRATSRGNRHTLHLLPFSGVGLSSLFFSLCFLSEEPFRPCPIFPRAFALFPCLSSRLFSSSFSLGWTCLSVASLLPPCSLPLPSPPCPDFTKPSSAAI